MVLANPTGTWSAAEGAALYGIDRWRSRPGSP
jgi:hypothetical protein